MVCTYFVYIVDSAVSYCLLYRVHYFFSLHLLISEKGL
jgi:hypothetical protein